MVKVVLYCIVLHCTDHGGRAGDLGDGRHVLEEHLPGEHGGGLLPAVARQLPARPSGVHLQQSRRHGHPKMLHTELWFTSKEGGLVSVLLP